ncbi:MAG TPA: helix-turn-helix domain-containing protein [Chitinophagaceae bacterium]|nr:helix-turn-helix domain-containing protein [Chitinophagaceae bacterium]
MKTPHLKYTVISSARQYNKYSKILEELAAGKKGPHIKDEIELLTVLIEKYDRENLFGKYPPVQLLSALMEENELTQAKLSKKLKVGPAILSDILYYRRGFSKRIIRKLADFFKISQEAFNRPYKLKVSKMPFLKKVKSAGRKRA